VKKNRFFLFLVLVFTVSLATSFLYSADDFVLSRVKDISDRNYEEAVIQLLDNAKDSVVISMYSINLGKGDVNPVKLLLNDLLEARQRGVNVTLYLNTRFQDDEKSGTVLIKSPYLKKLKDAGCIVHFIHSNRKLHDKLIIVDNRYIVEGSANWSNAALRRNFESSTLIDSQDLACVKLARIENLVTLSTPRDKGPYTPAYIENLPKTLTIPKPLLLDKRYFSSMVSRYDERAMDLYLLLLAHSLAAGKQGFFVSLEAIGLSLGLPDTWSNTALRRQVIRSLKNLQDRYNLINVKFYHGRDASVALTDIKGESFIISTDSIIKAQNTQLTMRLKFLLLIQALLKEEGKGLYSVSQAAVAKRFNVNRRTIHDAFNDLREGMK